MDLLAESEELGLGSRLKRLSDRLYAEVEAIYAARSIQLNPRLFPLLFVLRQKQQIGIVELAAALRVTHAAVSMLVKRAKGEGLVSVFTPKTDERCRLVQLTKSGAALVRDLEPVWLEIRSTLHDLLDREAPQFLSSISSLEQALERRSLAQRLGAGAVKDELEVVLWDKAYSAAFRDLNIEWIGTHFEIEQRDRELLNAPEHEIINRGGMIFFARVKGTVVGTAALLPMGEGGFELGKMAVSSLVQGKGIGRKLLLFIIDWAKKQGASLIYLETSRKLESAIQLYHSLGFVECTAAHPSDYRRADVFMQRALKR